jgi:hypothetical protein
MKEDQVSGELRGGAMVSAENQVIENKKLIALHRGVAPRKGDTPKMKVYPYGLLKTKDMKK